MSTASARTPTGPRGYPLVGVLPWIWRDPLGFFGRVAREHGPVARFGVGRFTLYLLARPEAVEHVLVGNARNYWKGAGLAAARPLLGEGLVASEGEHWLRQRRLMSPAFQRQRLLGLVPALRAEVEALVARWEAAADRGASVEVVPDASALAQRAIVRGLFGGELSAGATAELGEALAEGNAYVNAAAWTLLPLPEALPTPRRRRFARALATLDRVVYGLIAARRARQAPAGEPDLLDRLIAARDPESGAGMSDRELRDEVMTLFVAGHDTTASALAFTLHALAGSAEARARLEDELAAVLGGRPLEAEDLARLPCLERTLEESLRLYPPAWILVRTPRAADVVCGFAVPKDAPLLISPWVLHRDPATWPDPERFDPDRFLPERAAGRPRCAYLPFGGGQRLCIGRDFALLLLGVAVATIAARLRLEHPPGARVVPQPLTTLRPQGPLPMRPRRRS